MDRYQTAYQLHYCKNRADGAKQEEEEEELDLGNELITYLKNLYYDPHTEDTLRLPYTTTRGNILLPTEGWGKIRHISAVPRKMLIYLYVRKSGKN